MTGGYLRHFIACNNFDIKQFSPFFINGKRYGFVRSEVAEFLSSSLPTDFSLRDSALYLSDNLSGFDARSEALLSATKALAARRGKELRHEMYPVVEEMTDAPLAQVDRIAVPWFGVRAWGVHVNGFVRKKDGIHMWIGKRASDRPAEPGKLDHIIGGGQPIGLTPEQNLCKEAKEEAGIEEGIALTAKKVGELRYSLQREDGVRNDTILMYDLELPDGFMPTNTDGEVESFSLMPISEVAVLVKDTNEFKLNCNMVITDFLVRYGAISPECSEYAEIKKWLCRNSRCV